MKSGNLNFLEPSGPLQACNGTALALYLFTPMYEGHLESKERFAIKKYLLIIGKKRNMQILSHTFTYFST